MPRKKNTNVKADDRSENWSFVLFSDSLDERWIERLRSTFIPTLVSPEHDADTNEDGTLKKKHYHIQFIFDSKKDATQVWDIALQIGRNAIGGSQFTEYFDDWSISNIEKRRLRNGREVYDAFNDEGIKYGQIQKVKSRSGMARYLVHMDNPEKEQYNSYDIQRYMITEDKLVDWLGGTYDKHVVIREMKKYCRENEVTSFSDLCDYAELNHPETWEKALNDCAAYIMDKYIKGLAYKQKSSAIDRANEAFRKYSKAYAELKEIKSNLLDFEDGNR